jgi:hypothetical protein
MTTDALEERRKKTTLRKVKRKHSGKVTQPYAIMEKLIKEVGQFHPLNAAKIVIVWKSGWKPTKDDILKHAQIRKLSELEREIWGDEYDLCLMLHRELWQSSKFTEQQREMDIFHELCHVTAEIDDKTGDQKLDDRDRLCWRLRNHPIQRFPEEIERYGIEAVLDLDVQAMTAAADEISQAEAKKSEADSNRPLLRAGENRKLESIDIERLQDFGKVSEKQCTAIRNAGLETIGALVTHMRAQNDWWHREITGIGKNTKTPIEDAVAAAQAACLDG